MKIENVPFLRQTVEASESLGATWSAQVLFGRAISTVDPKNIEEVLSKQFHSKSSCGTSVYRPPDMSYVRLRHKRSWPSIRLIIGRWDIHPRRAEMEALEGAATATLLKAKR